MNDIFNTLSKSAKKRKDARGSLNILYESSSFTLKRSFSKKGVFRGMHYQKDPYLQTKIIRVISGSIIDFIVNVNSMDIIFSKKIDAGSDWIEINSNFLHGFYALEDTYFEYICDGIYHEPSEQCYSITNFLEDTMEIINPILSEKDLHAQQLNVVLANAKNTLDIKNS